MAAEFPREGGRLLRGALGLIAITPLIGCAAAPGLGLSYAPQPVYVAAPVYPASLSYPPAREIYAPAVPDSAPEWSQPEPVRRHVRRAPSGDGEASAPRLPAEPPASDPDPAPVARPEPREAERLPACGYWRLGGILWPCER